jgi:hypothetical protein
MARRARLAAAAALFLSTALRADTVTGDACEVTYPPEARAVAEWIAQVFPAERASAAAWLGLRPAGRPQIFLARDYDEMIRWAPGAPPWAVAVTRRDDRIVLRLDRLDSSPANALEVVLRHEIVHQVLTYLGGLPGTRTLPRWFEEGLCVTRAGVAYLGTDMPLPRMAAAGHLPRLEAVDAMFAGDANDAGVAYAYGGAMVREFLGRHGDDGLHRLLEAVRGGGEFPDAFRETTGETLDAFEARWRESITPRMPFLLYLLLENLTLSLLFLGALLVLGGYIRWRFRRTRAMASLGDG